MSFLLVYRKVHTYGFATYISDLEKEMRRVQPFAMMWPRLSTIFRFVPICVVSCVTFVEDLSICSLRCSLQSLAPTKSYSVG